MTTYQQAAVAAIEQQQRGIENTAPWVAGEQLKDICRQEPASAEQIAHDLTIPEMSITKAEQKIKAWANKHKKGSFAYVPPHVAEDILRKFYGLPRLEDYCKPHPLDARPLHLVPPSPLGLNLEDFL